jgi:alcohol dehydrogenase class IV
MRFEFATAQRIVVAPGSSAELADLAGAIGRRAMLVQGRGGPEERLLDDLVAALRELVGALGIPRLAEYGLTAASVPELAAKAARASSTRANPIDLEPAELEEAIGAAI